MHRQVVVTGTGRAGGAGRDRGVLRQPGRADSQLGAWASAQSQVVPDRAALDESFVAAGERFGAGEIPAPPHWGGLRVAPETVEFWQGRSSRLHDRLRFRRVADGGWVVERLAP